MKYFYVIKIIIKIILSNLFRMQKNTLNKIEKLFLDTEGMNDKLTPFEIDIIIERLSLIKRFLKR